MRLILAALLCLAGPAAMAETFQLSLGGDPIGTLVTTDTSLRSDVTNSPLGVANGTFEASAKRVRNTDGNVVTQYIGISHSKGRTVSVLMDQGRALDTTVSPTSEATDLSDAAAVPAGILHPVAAMRHLMSATGCPRGIQIYDGRRVVAMTPDGQSTGDGTLTCKMRYRVTAGPGHLSPLFLSRAAMTVTYATSGGQSLRQITVSSGPFTLYISR